MSLGRGFPTESRGKPRDLFDGFLLLTRARLKEAPRIHLSPSITPELPTG